MLNSGIGPIIALFANVPSASASQAAKPEQLEEEVETTTQGQRA